MLLRGATTDDFCNGDVGGIAQGLANNWRKWKCDIAKEIKKMGGHIHKKRVTLPTGRDIYRYKIRMPMESDHKDPLGWLELPEVPAAVQRTLPTMTQDIPDDCPF